MGLTCTDVIFITKNRLLYASKKICKYYDDKIFLPSMFYLYANFKYCTLVIMVVIVTIETFTLAENREIKIIETY